MLVPSAPLLIRARKNGYAVPAFNINNLEIAQAVLETAAEMRSPVILQTSEGAIDYAGMDYLAAIAHTGSRLLKIPVAFHLDHGTNVALVEKAIASGLYTSVMIDGSRLPLAENIKLTRRIVELAHRQKISVEAELGAIPGVEDKLSVTEREAYFTDPEQAEKFVQETKCDALAIAVGTAHGAYKSTSAAILDLARLKKIAALVKIPLVLHGASGVSQKILDAAHQGCERLGDCERLEGATGIPNNQIKAAVKNGIAKINIDTDLRIAFTAGIRAALIKDRHVFDPRKILGPAKELMKKVVKEKIALFGAKEKV